MNISKEIFNVIEESTRSAVTTPAWSTVTESMKLDVINSVSVFVMLTVSTSMRNYVQEYPVGKVMNEYEY